MGIVIREAGAGDLERVVALTKVSRGRLAGWAPRWWAPAAGADEMHPLWLGHLIGSSDHVVRVAEEDGSVVGCAAVVLQGAHWVIDDVAVVDDSRWADVGVALLSGIPERPALTCVPTAHAARVSATKAVGLRCVSGYWIRGTDVPTGEAPVAAVDHGGMPEVDPPSHTFGGPLDPGADGALVVRDEAGGVLVGSASIMAPPVYDPGGPVCVVDRVIGDDRAGLVRAALAGAGRRGDVLLNVVAGSQDHDLQHVLEEAGFEHIVDVYM